MSTSTRTPLDLVVDALEHHGHRIHHDGPDQVNAQCPAHDDRNPSLSIRYDRTAGKLLLNCHTGCRSADIIAALGLTWRDLFDHQDDTPDTTTARARRPDIVATYDYRDADGQLLFQKLRMHPKDFRVRRPDPTARDGWTWRIGDAPRVLYRLPELTAAITAGKPVMLVEGEKDADRVRAELGIVATCNYEGAAKDGQRPKWRPEYTQQLTGAHVIIVADNDAAGMAHAHAAAAALTGHAADVKVFRPAVNEPKADISDHLDDGHTLDDLVPVLRPDATPAAAETELPTVAEAAGHILFPGLPTTFWESREVLRHIRTAAHSRMQVPDIVFYTLLTRLAAIVSHHIVADSGIGSAASLTFYAALLGYSGDGKTEGSKIAAELMPIPDGLDCEDALPLGSGEGIAEAFMGMVNRMVPVGTQGRTKNVPVRKQVRHNALFFVDEGETLVRTMERPGSTVGGMMRSAWSGTTIGQRNASDERTRIVRAGTYTLGLAIGLQPDVALPLLADSHTGMPQRLCWSTASDPTLSDDPLPWPGELPWDPRVVRADTRIRIWFPDTVTAELRAQALARRRGEIVVDELDGQAPLMRVKLAALLALLDSRQYATTEDWALASVVWDTSCAVRAELLKHADQMRTRENQARTDLLVDREVAKTLAVSGVGDKVLRVARMVADRVHEGGAMTTGQAWRALSSADRKHGRVLLDAAVQHAAAQGWIDVGDSGLQPGAQRPVVARGPQGRRH